MAAASWRLRCPSLDASRFSSALLATVVPLPNTHWRVQDINDSVVAVLIEHGAHHVDLMFSNKVSGGGSARCSAVREESAHQCCQSSWSAGRS